MGAVADDRAGDKTAKMPRRQRTRTQQRTAAILAERRANHQHHTNPPPPRFIPDEHIEYHDTFPPHKTQTHHPSEWATAPA